jgi:hypothetical protein
MHTRGSTAASGIDQALSRGFDLVQARRLAFVRWSMFEGYAQFSEYVTADDPIVEARPDSAPVDGRTATIDSRREGQTA